MRGEVTPLLEGSDDCLNEGDNQSDAGLSRRLPLAENLRFPLSLGTGVGILIRNRSKARVVGAGVGIRRALLTRDGKGCWVALGSSPKTQHVNGTIKLLRLALSVLVRSEINFLMKYLFGFIEHAAFQIFGHVQNKNNKKEEGRNHEKFK